MNIMQQDYTVAVVNSLLPPYLQTIQTSLISEIEKVNKTTPQVSTQIFFEIWANATTDPQEYTGTISPK
jgi:hypothetical protein